MKNIITVLILVLAVLMTACDGDNGVSAASTTNYDQPTSSDGSEQVVTPSSSSEVVYYPDPVPVKWSGYYGKICDKVMQFKDEITTSSPDIALTRLETVCPRSDIYYLKCSDMESIRQRIRRISIPNDAVGTPSTQNILYNGYQWFDFTDLKAFVMILPCEYE